MSKTPGKSHFQAPETCRRRRIAQNGNLLQCRSGIKKRLSGSLAEMLVYVVQVWLQRDRNKAVRINGGIRTGG